MKNTRMRNFEKERAAKREFWDVKKSGEYLLWLLSPDENGNYKNINSSEKSFNALKSVLGFINRQSTGNVKNNQLFAKLYIHFLTQGIRYHSTTVFNDFIHKELHQLLSYPLPLFYKAFIKDLHDNQLNRMLEVKEEQLQEVLIDAQRFKEVYNEDFVESKLNEMVSEALNRFS